MPHVPSFRIFDRFHFGECHELSSFQQVDDFERTIVGNVGGWLIGLVGLGEAISLVGKILARVTLPLGTCFLSKTCNKGIRD